MSRATRFKAALLSLISPSASSVSTEVRGPASEAGEYVSDSSVLALSAAWACGNLLAGTIASLPLMVYRETSEGTRRVESNHPLYRLLHDSPNYDQTAVDFGEFMQLAQEFWGNAYARIVREAGRIIGLVPIRPDLVSVKRLPNGSIEYAWTEEGRAYRLTDVDVLHIRGFGGAPLGGMSTLQFARQTFGLAQAVDRAAASTFRNGLRTNGALVFKEWLTPEQRDLAERKLVEKYLGAQNSGRPLVLEGGQTWQPFSMNPEDAQMLESRRFSVEEVCRFFGVPPHMVGHTEKTTSWGTGIEQQTLAFQKFTLRRRLKRNEQAMEKQLLTPQERARGVRIEYNLEGLLRGDSQARASFYQSALQNGWMTINEVRALENRPPIEGGDVPRMQAQNIPITQAPEAPALPQGGPDDNAD